MIERAFFPHALVITAVVFICYIPVFHADYISLDDDTHYTRNPRTYELSLENIKRMLNSPLDGNYVILPELSFSIERAVFGLNARVSHVINLIGFLLTCWGVWFFARRLGLSTAGAGWAAVVFAVHPAHVSSVAWVAERKDIICGFFYVAALTRYAVPIHGRPLKRMTGVTALGAMALLSKAMAVSLPLALLLIDRLQGRKFDRRALLEKMPLALLSVFIAVLTVRSHHDIQFDVPITNAQKLALLIWELGYYMRLFWFPARLQLNEPMPPDIDWDYPPVIFSLLALCAVTVVFNLCKPRPQRTRVKEPEACGRLGHWVRWAIAFFFCTLVFALRPVPVGVEVVAERYLYLPSLGFCLLIGRLLDRVRLSWPPLPARPCLIGAAVLAILTALGARTYLYARAWRSPFSFWPYMLSRNGHFAVGHNNFGLDLLGSGKVHEGLRHLHEAVKINPEYDEAHMNLAIQLAGIKDYDHAIKHAGIALALRPDDPSFILNTGHIFYEMGKYHEAIKHYIRTLAILPHDVDGLMGMANAHYKLGEPGKAVRYFQEILAIDPENRPAGRNLNIVRATLSNSKVKE